MRIQNEIESLLQTHFTPAFLLVENESHQHNVPAGSESHFKAVIVADAFVDKRLVQRHQLVYKALGDVVRDQIHALALHTYTPEEWQTRQENAPDSPACRGGSQHQAS